MKRREFASRAVAAPALTGLGLALALALTGCAGMATLTAEVATYGEWPAGRSAGTYAFERLPSQRANLARQEALEAAAATALQAAGFRAAAEGSEPQFLVQIGARITRTERSPWDDPLWWRGGFGTWRHSPWVGPGWSGWARRDWPPRYEREVALLLRDRAQGQPLYEARASSDGTTQGDAAMMAAMFQAAMKDFPASSPTPRSVTVPLAR